MKSRIFLLIIVLLSTLQISFANNKIDNLFKKNEGAAKCRILYGRFQKSSGKRRS